MASHKFHALAGQVTKQRLEHLNKIHSLRDSKRYIARTRHELEGKQISLPFMGRPRGLEVFHQFDADARQIEWSFYTQDGDFLLQFGFCLGSKEYEVHTIHPSLFSGRPEMNLYRKAIEENLDQHFPALELVKGKNGKVEICQR